MNAYPDGYVQQVYGLSAHSGDYVRKDVLRASHDLTRLQEGYEAAPASRSPFERWQERLPRWLGGTRGLTPPELMAIGLDVRYKVPNPRKATRPFERVLEGEPNHYGATYQLAAALDATGRTEDARPVWRRMREMALDSKDLSTLAAAEQRLGGGYDPTIEESMQAGLTALYTLRDPHRAIE